MDQEKTRLAALLHTVLIWLIMLLLVINVLLIIASFVSNEARPDTLVSVVSILVFLGLIALVRIGLVSGVGSAWIIP